jgi:hypothetical protein
MVDCRVDVDWNPQQAKPVARFFAEPTGAELSEQRER